MPSTPYASIRLATNGGAAVAGTIVAVADDVITCSTLSTVGWKTSNLPTIWQITAYPEGWVADTGWVLNNATLYFEYAVGGDTGMLPPPITMPSAVEIAAGLWGKWKIRLLVNGGGGQLTDWTAGIKVLSQTGLEDVAVYEGFEFDSFRAWVGSYQRAARIWDAAIAGGIGGGASLGAGTPAVLTASAGTQGALATAAPFDHRHQVSTSVCVTIGAANSIGVSTSLARADHVHDHGALLGGDRHALAVAGVSHGFISATSQTKLEGIEAGAQVVNWTNVRAAVNAASSDLPLNAQKITGLAAGTNPTDAVNLAQLNALANGLDLKLEVRGASLGNQALSGALTEDGITYATNDRYLAKDQSDQTQNGLYIVNTAGAWTRSPDADVDAEVTPGLFVFVKSGGTVNGGTGWALLVAGPVTIGVTNLVFSQIFGPGAVIAGAGMTQSGNTLNVVANADGSIVVNANDIQVGVITDAQHGSRGNGTLHSVADSTHNGFMPMGHWILVDGATATPTASKIMKWGASVDAGAAYFYDANYSGSLAASGWLRLGVGATTVLAGRSATGSTTRSLIRWSAAKLFLGDEADETQIDAVNIAHIGVSGSKSIYVTASGIQIFGGGTTDFGGGIGVIGMNAAGTEPTTNPASGKIVFWVYGGALKTRGPKGLVSTLARDADAEQALQIEDKWWRTVQTTDVAAGVGTYADALPVNSSFVLELNVIGVEHGTDSRCHYKVIASGGRAAGSLAVDATDVQEIFDAIGVPNPTVSNSSNHPQLNCLGKASTVIDWTSYGTIVIVAPTP